jgi:hypothetical protein
MDGEGRATGRHGHVKLPGVVIRCGVQRRRAAPPEPVVGDPVDFGALARAHGDHSPHSIRALNIGAVPRQEAVPGVGPAAAWAPLLSRRASLLNVTSTGAAQLYGLAMRTETGSRRAATRRTATSGCVTAETSRAVHLYSAVS